MKFEFESIVIFWHGPSPYYFAAVPSEINDTIKELSHELSYGWGCIPVNVQIGNTKWKTSLMPKNGIYLVPIKLIIQKELNISINSIVNINLIFDSFHNNYVKIFSE